MCGLNIMKGFNFEFDWDPDHLSNEPPLEGLPIPITMYMVKAISKMKSGKAAGPSGIEVEVIKAAGYRCHHDPRYCYYNYM